MKYLLAIDQGTSSTRAILYSIDGKIIKTSQYPITMSFPHPGWVEQDPEEIWEKTLMALREVTSEIDVRQIKACGLTNQRETVVAWDKKTGKTLGPAIVWQDRRTEACCQALSQYQTIIHDKTGLKIDPYFSATKMRWLLTHHKGMGALARQGQVALGTVDSFLIWRLTEGLSFKTDTTNASRTLLFNIHELQWDQELLDLFSIPHQVLPEVQACDGDFGFIAKQWLGHKIPITGVAGDQQAALIGQGCLDHGMIKATFGTGAFFLMNTGKSKVDSEHGLLTTISYTVQDKTAYGLEGSIYHAGTAVRWLRDELKLIKTSAETEKLARSLSSNEGVYFVSAFTGLGAPYWYQNAGGVLCGLTQGTTRAHIARAVLEGVCYQARGVVEAMREDSGLLLSLLRVDGGMAVNDWFLQFLANQCGLVVQRPEDVETTAKGAAMLAALGAGIYKDLQEIQELWEAKTTLSPESGDNVEADYLGWQKALGLLIT